MVDPNALWSSVGGLIDRASIDGILVHKLAPLAAGRRRSAGEPVPEVFAAEERIASLAGMIANPVLQRIREVGEGPLVLLKGPEVAALYPANGRRFGDIDVLTPDAPALHHALREHGFVEMETPFDHGGHHHLVPLRWPVIPLYVEVHSAPNWPQGVLPPSVEEILEAAVPSVVEVEGFLAPSRLHHALLFAAHSWAHEPLLTLRDLIDITVLAADENSADLSRGANAWNIGRIWRTTWRAIEALFFEAPPTFALHIWARHLAQVRERTVFETHLQAALHPFWERPPVSAITRSLEAVRADLRPAHGESWGMKVGRAERAIREARLPRTKRPATAEKQVEQSRRP